VWTDKLQWDESLPQSLETAWSKFCKEVSEIGYGEIARYVLQSEAIVDLNMPSGTLVFWPTAFTFMHDQSEKAQSRYIK